MGLSITNELADCYMCITGTSHTSCNTEQNAYCLGDQGSQSGHMWYLTQWQVQIKSLYCVLLYISFVMGPSWILDVA